MIILKKNGKNKKPMKDKIKNLIGKVSKKLAPYKNKLIIPLLEIFGLIIVCALIVHFLTNSETLAEYAANNPDIAYHTEETEP